MQKSLEGSDRTSAADTYSELAFHTAIRASMWKRRPDRELIEGWIEQALALSEPDTPARARALIARSYSDRERFGEAAREARELAECLGDNELRSWAWEASAWVAYSRGDYEEGFAWSRRRCDLVPQLTDPDHIAQIYFYGRIASVLTGRFDEARRDVEALDEVTKRLTPHHRLHAAAALIDVELAAGRWERVRDLTARAEAAVAANIATPCALNVCSLLGCALASIRLGNEQEARRLERSADDLGMEGYGAYFEPWRIEILLARGELAEVERKLDEWSPGGFGDVDGLVVRLNALVALGRRAEIEQEAPALLGPGTYLEPFALRALGFARHDDLLIEQAIDRFEAMGLDWHAAETSKLLVPA
jgi:tetratricopeptide (TPR) repeat protein